MLIVDVRHSDMVRQMRLPEEERILPPAPLNRQAIAVGVANAQREWPRWAPQTRNLFLRSILFGVLLNGRLVMPVPLDDVRRMIALAEAREAA